jgi:hypothetical protein
MKKVIIALAMISLITVSCGSDDSNGDGNNTATVALSLPTDNSECISGTSVNNLQSTVIFEWAAVANTETYFVNVMNLNNQALLQYNAGTATSHSIDLLKGTPYSWYVTSKKASGEMARSRTWKFYNAGAPVSNHAPFPADLVSPAMSSTITDATVMLKWDSSDIDNDIVNHKVYMDNNTNPTTLVGTVTAESIENLPVTPGGTYYWKIVTTDGGGNATTSPVYQFKVR